MNITEQIIEIEEVSIPDLIKGEKGDTGAQGEKGEKPVKGVDYFTPEDIQDIGSQIVDDLSIPDLRDYAKTADVPTIVEEAGFIKEETEPKFTAAEPQLAKKSELFSGNYNDLTNKPTIPSTTGLATETYVDNAVANVKVDLTGYATENWVEAKGYLTEH